MQITIKPTSELFYAEIENMDNTNNIERAAIAAAICGYKAAVAAGRSIYAESDGSSLDLFDEMFGRAICVMQGHDAETMVLSNLEKRRVPNWMAAILP